MTKKHMGRGGQLFSGDLAVATMVFIAALAFAFFIWNSTTEDINHAEDQRNLQKLAASTAEQLIRTPGVPSDWIPDCDGIDAQVFGLANEDRVIDTTKAGYFIEAMNATNYENCKYLLGLGEYDFYMDVKNLTGSQVYVNGTEFVAGKPLADSGESIAVMRTAIYDNNLVRVTVIIWR